MSKLLISGLISLLAGAVLMILGQMWALLLFMAGFVLIIAGWAQLFKGAGYQADISAHNGLNGHGAQQSEMHKDKNIPREYEDRPANK